MKWYPAGDYCFHLIRTSNGARCRIEFHSYSDNREEEFAADRSGRKRKTMFPLIWRK